MDPWLPPQTGGGLDCSQTRGVKAMALKSFQLTPGKVRAHARGSFVRLAKMWGEACFRIRVAELETPLKPRALPALLERSRPCCSHTQARALR